jgi:hypothetical protein
LLKRKINKLGKMMKGKKINFLHQMPSVMPALKIIKKSLLQRLKLRSPQRFQFLCHAQRNLLTLTKILLRM